MYLSETKIERALCKEVKRLKGFAVKFWPKFVTGFPDRIVLLPGGRIIFVECKATDGQLSSMQKRWRTRLIKLGFAYRVVNDLNFDFLKEYTK